MGLITNQSSFPLNRKQGRQDADAKAKTHVSVGGIHQLPVLTRLGSTARPAGTGVAGARFSGDLTGFGPGRGSWACG